jgi:hypothetical protein
MMEVMKNLDRDTMEKAAETVGGVVGYYVN